MSFPAWFVVFWCAITLGVWIAALGFIASDDLLVGGFVAALATLVTYLAVVAIGFQHRRARERIMRALPFVGGAVSIASLTIAVIAVTEGETLFAAICFFAGVWIGAASIYIPVQVRRLRNRFPTGT